MRKVLVVAMVLAGFALASFSVMADASAKLCSVGDKAQVLWKSKWYPAKVLKAEENRCFIHYDGYAASWDEWVGADRIKSAASNPYPVGTAVSVNWKGSWYPAKVIAAKTNSWKIHYDGYAASWDEWIDKDRIKK